MINFMKPNIALRKKVILMALISSHFPCSLSSKVSPSSFTIRHRHSCSLPNFSFSTSTLSRCSAGSSQMESNGRPGFKEFPYASPAIKDLMVDLLSTVENRLDSLLLPCTLPQDVEYFENQSGTAHASLLLRPGAPSSSIDFILGSWIHCELPTGSALSITSLSSYMNNSTDAPNLVIEIIQSSPSSLVLILDLPPRKDLILYPEYLKTFYEDTELEKQRQVLDKIHEAQPYISPSLYIRSIFSPTAVVLRVDTSTSGGDRLEQILRDNVSGPAQQVLNTWLDLCALGEKRGVGDDEKACLKKRDSMYKSKSIENDIGASLPRMFDPQKADRVLEVLKAVL